MPAADITTNLKAGKITAVAAVLCIAVIETAIALSAGTVITGPSRVVDDDTVIVDGIVVRLKGVDAALAAQNIGGGVACHDVVERIAGTIDRRGSDQAQILQIGAKRVGDCAVDLVGAAAGKLGDGLTRRVDEVGVVATLADHDIDAAAAVDYERNKIVRIS